MRNDDETPSSDPDKFARLKEGLIAHCPDMIIQFSTGGRSGAVRERGGMLPLRPEMASLSVGSNNFPTRVYENPPDLVDWLAAEMMTHDIKPEIEAFDLSHIYKAAQMHAAGQIAATPCVQFVMGVKNAMPADEVVFDFYVQTVGGSLGRMPFGAPLVLVRRNCSSMNGLSAGAATHAPVWKITCGWIAQRWPHQMPR